MTTSPETERTEEPEFRWGKKRGKGGKNKDVQFYESFTYDGVDYSLHDCVYLHVEGEPAPYIAKLLKIWENVDNSKKIKVQWFFYPFEISHYLKDVETLENELFFASGAGTGLMNINPLETIGGKCNVVCVSKDNRNLQPSAEQLQMADFVVYRTFDVGLCTISDQLDDKIGGLEVKFVFNRKEDFDRLGKDGINVVALKETPNLEGLENVLQKESLVVKHQPKHEIDNENKSMKKESGLLRNHSGVKDKVEDIKLLANQVQVEDKVKFANKSSTLDDALPKRAHIDGKVASSKVNSTNGAPIPEKDDATQLVTSAIQSKAKPKNEVKSSCGSEKDSRLAKKPSNLDEKLSKKSVALIKGTPNETTKLPTPNISPTEKQNEGRKFDFRGHGQAPNLETTSNGLRKSRLKKSIDASSEKRKHVDDVGYEIKDTKLSKYSSHMEEGSIKKAKFEDSIRKPKVDDSVDGTTVKKFKKKISASEEGPTKKAKVEDSIRTPKVDDNNDSTTIKKLKEKSSAGEAKYLPTLLTFNVDKAKSKIDNGPLEHHGDKKGKLSNDDLPKVSITTSKGKDKKVEGQKFEVLPRPLTEKSNWIKLPWGERMKAAHDQGKLVLLMNLPPYCTSGEVEDIIWHAFKENCTAKVLQHTATSNLTSGQAFVIFKTREVAERVLKELDDGSLMLPGRRPLVACTGVLPKSSKQKTFYGHLGIDKARMQIQRELKEAVSTSHYSQANTIEYDMAMSWCLQQSKSDKCWEKLYEQQDKDLKKLMAGLKSK